MDGTGFYAFIDLPPGSYTVTASKTGYPNATAIVNVALGAVTGNMYQQDFVLSTAVTPKNPPHVDTIALTPQGQVQLRVSGDPGRYAVEASTNLQSWAELTNITATNTAFSYEEPQPSLTWRFYRVRLLP